MLSGGRISIVAGVMLVSLGLVVASIIPRVRVYHVDQRKIDKECAHKITFKYVFKD